jgi:hypothetical protein
VCTAAAQAGSYWLNLRRVQEALHVKLVGKSKFGFSTGLHYNFTAHSLLDEYRATLVTHFRVLQFSGDADPCVPYVGTSRWIESLELPVSSPWRPWTACVFGAHSRRSSCAAVARSLLGCCAAHVPQLRLP